MKILKQNYIHAAFTLAEVMITLTVIGIIAAVIIPVAIHSTPDESVLKFKKGHDTLYKVISTLVNSDEYYLDGDLGILADGSYAGQYAFCNSFADVVSAKDVVCNYTPTTTYNGFDAMCTVNSSGCYRTVTDSTFKVRMDTYCNKAFSGYTGSNIGVLTTDGIYYYELNTQNFFGCLLGVDCDYSNSGWGSSSNGTRLYGDTSHDIVTMLDDGGIKTSRYYRYFCMDIDGINDGEAPFGYGIRVDGKIMSGNRAEVWLNKSIQGDDD